MQLFLGKRRLASVLEDLVHDFLEIKAKLSFAKREMIIDRLKTKNVQANRIYSAPCFSADRICIVVHTHGMPKEVWVYNPKINEFKMLEVNQS